MIELVDPSDRPAHPRTGYVPERVLRVALEGLREPDVPSEGDGLRTAYHMLSPRLRREFGGFDGFVGELDGPLYSGLYGHTDEERGRPERGDDGEVRQEVTITGPDDEEFVYEFGVVKQSEGKYEGCWLVDDVMQLLPYRKPGFSHHPTVTFGDEEIKCNRGDNLRSVLFEAAGISPYNSHAQDLNCGGNAICGTCAVEVENAEVGETVTDRTSRERVRLSGPPFPGEFDSTLRLACQTRVLDDLEVTKHQGLWGQHVDSLDGDAVAEWDPGEEVVVTEDEYEYDR